MSRRVEYAGVGSPSASDPRILFIGGTRRGHAMLAALLKRGEPVVCVLALEQDDHEHDRFDEEMRKLAAAAEIPCSSAGRIDSALETEIVERLRPDLIVIVGWRTMIPMSIVEAPPLGCVGAHDSLLPRGRGFAPTNWTIINGEAEGGVTLFHLAEEVDAGDIVGQVRVPVGPRMTAPELYRKVTDATVDLVLEHLPELKAGTAPRIVQDHAQASFLCARRPEDGVIDWAEPTYAIDRLVRGLAFPYPGARTQLEGDELIVWEAEPVEPAPGYIGRVPGRPVRLGADGGVDVLTADGVLRLHRVQREGEAVVAAAEVIRSVKTTLGR